MSKFYDEFNSQDIEILAGQAQVARAAILKMTALAASGHPGGSMSSIDVLLSLYRMINLSPANFQAADRDNVIVSIGHISPAVYSSLALHGFFDIDAAIAQFRTAGSIFEGHIEPEVPGVEWATGNLGQGLSVACGFALANQIKGIKAHNFVIMGDGEQQKGQIAEARRLAVKYALPITCIIDSNKLQISGDIAGVMPQNIIANFESDGWYAIEIDGHDFKAINAAIIKAKNSSQPCVIISHAVMGKGVSFMENKAGYHGSPLSLEQLDTALVEMGMPNDISKYQALRAAFVPVDFHMERNNDLVIKTGEPRVYTTKTDNRSAWGNALHSVFSANENPQLAVWDCDLAGSVKTGSIRDNFPANFIQAGIAEHNVAVAAGAMSIRGIQTFWADFGVFGVDEVYNQLRLNDINKTNLKVICTHCGLDVGEDGKTHQCIDYVGAMRNIFNFPVVIPADPNQTDRIIRWLATRDGNYLVPMGRSKVMPLLNENGDIFFDADYKFLYGVADCLRTGDAAAIISMGALVPAAVQAADKLRQAGIEVQVWNISSPMQLDKHALAIAASTGHIVTVEDHNVNTGLGSLVSEALFAMKKTPHLERLGVADYACSGLASDVYKMNGLDADSIVSKVKELLGE